MTGNNPNSVTQTQPVSSQSENRTVNASFIAESITESYMYQCERVIVEDAAENTL